MADGIEVIKIPRLLSVYQYSDFVLRLADYNMEGEHFLILQDDGFVTSPHLFLEEFLSFDYIGASWPDDSNWIKRQHLQYYINFVGNGGFSLRSKNFLELSANFNTCNAIVKSKVISLGEDVFLTNYLYKYMIDNGIKFAPVEIAEKFSRENNLEDWTNPGRHDIISSFGFHGKNFENAQELIDLKNE